MLPHRGRLAPHSFALRTPVAQRCCISSRQLPTLSLCVLPAFWRLQRLYPLKVFYLYEPDSCTGNTMLGSAATLNARLSDAAAGGAPANAIRTQRCDFQM